MMPDLSDLLERASRTVDLEPDDFQRLLRRRDRKRRSERIKAGALILVVLVAAVWVVRDVASIDPDRAPIVPGGSPGTDPFVSINAQLAGDVPARDLFTVLADHAEYWRLYSLDHFDGEAWTSTSPDGTAGGVQISLPNMLPKTAQTPPGGETVNQTFRVLGEVPGGGALPMPLSPVEITASSFGEVTWDGVRGQAFIEGGLEPDMVYTVRSSFVIPMAQDVASLHFASAPDDGPWTQLPDDLDPRITRIAENWTAGATSDYGKIIDLLDHLKGPHTEFVYDADVPPLEGEDALYQFLHATKVGFCQQYAVAMATMLRTIGIPARIAVGYQAGTLQDNGSYLVTTQDAHAWVEVLFPTYGWLPFDPTPGRSSLPDAAPGSYLNPGAPTGAS